MQFKHPEILYVLFALLIPVFIHLFQLQRFTKTPFTNVKFLKEIELQTRKSSRLKKWLVLLTRLVMFASIIIAFAQPFFSENDISKDWITIIYLDNSLSMKAKGERGELFKRAVQDIVEYLPDKGQFSLLTNNQNLNELSKNLLVEQLKNSDYSPVNTNLKTILLKAKAIFNKNPDKHHKLLLFSDFQNTNIISTQTEKTTIGDYISSSNQAISFVQLTPQIKYNISIDSVFTAEKNMDNIVLEVILLNQGKEAKNTSVNAVQNEIVLAKNTLDIQTHKYQKLSLRVPNKIGNITIKIDADDAFNFDNSYNVSFHQQNKINVLALSENNLFLKRIYTSDEFSFILKKPNQISFEQIDKQQLVVLNGLLKIPQNFQDKLSSFVKKGGSLIIIPNKNNSINELNSFFNGLKMGQIINKYNDSLRITKIHFSHPILHNVFDKKVTNFQYPTVFTYFESAFSNTQPILSFENQQPFISQIKIGKGNVFWIAAPLDLTSSNFTKAPLIVPIFYNIGKQSNLQTQLSYRIGKENRISVNQQLQQNEVLHITGKQANFIPLQEIQSEKVILITNDQPQKSGFYEVKNKDIKIQNLAFNNPKNESNMSFFEMTNLTDTNKNIHQYTSIKKALSELTMQQSIQSYFKWFVLLAFLFLLIEILLLKYL